MLCVARTWGLSCMPLPSPVDDDKWRSLRKRKESGREREGKEGSRANEAWSPESGATFTSHRLALQALSVHYE